MSAVETKRQISHDEAKEIAQRFIDSNFGNAGKERPRISIPANTERDDDILLLSYIAQQERSTKALKHESGAVAKPEGRSA